MKFKSDLNKNWFYLLLFFAMLSWGISWSNAKVIGEYLPSKTIMFWRFLFSSFSLIPILFFTRFTYKQFKSSILGILIASVLLVGYNYCYFTGTHLGLAGMGGVVVTTLVPVFTILFTRIYFRIKIKQSTWIGIILGLISGMLILQLWKYTFEEIVNNGNIYFILGAIIWAVLTIITQKVTQNLDTLFYSFFTFFISAVLLAVMIPSAIDFSIFNQDGRFWIHFLSVTLGAMSFGTVAFFYAAKNLGSHRAGSFVFLVPVSALGFSMWILNEIPELISLVGAGLAIAAVYIINLSQQNHSES